jgi:uncharacterized protein YcbX
MSVIGTVAGLSRYPVKSMRGEPLDEAFVGFSGVYGDRIFAFTSSASPAGFPFLTARDQREMLRYRPRFRHPERAAQPLNLAAAERLGPGITPLYGDATDLMVDVETPTGETLAIDDPALIRRLSEGLDKAPTLALLRSERALTDCRPVSLFSLQTARQIEAEIGAPVDPRRFRANVYLDLSDPRGFGEDAFVGRRLHLGSKVVVSVLERDPRCQMITLDPDTGVSTPALLRPVAQAHDGMAGIYGAVLVEGMVRPGDAVDLLD